jgi:hypothetical protein
MMQMAARCPRRWGYFFCLIFVLSGSICAAFAELPDSLPQPRISAVLSNGLPWLSIPFTTNADILFDLESSPDLVSWSKAGTFRVGLAPYPDLANLASRRYYRALQYRGTNNWANQTADWRFSKFVIVTNEPDRVYFHRADFFHYQFAREQFSQFATLSADQFDAIAIHPPNQEAVIGGLLRVDNDVGIQFVTAEPFDNARLVQLFKTVAARLAFPDANVFLVPSTYDRQIILSNVTFFESQGVAVRDLSQIRPDNSVQSEGWTVGILKYISSDQLPAAIAAGLLTPDTILVTDLVPRDLPPIAGLISLTASSPNSHTVLRLHSQLLPYLDLPPDQFSTVSNLIGKTIFFNTIQPPPLTSYSAPPHYPPSWYSTFRLIDLATFSEALQAELLKRRANSLVPVPQIQRYGKYVGETEKLTPADARYFGSKAANYGLLRRTIPTNSEPAIALSFDLWLDFMAQRLASGKTLAEEISLRLDLIRSNAQQPVISAKLKEIRDLIEETAQFTPEQKAAITNALAIFDPHRKIRFRSSSNAEDLPTFSAAGLYDSYSGCLLDDLQPGPSNTCQCDPEDDKRRSVFRAIQKVYASFYNDQAYAERRQFNLDESQLGMAILIHYSFPDETELANGVATVDFYTPFSGSDTALQYLLMVTQRGAISVTNPSGPDLPERAYLNSSGFDLFPSIPSFSTVRPPNTPVLARAVDYGHPEGDEYYRFSQLFLRVGKSYPWTNFPGVNRLQFEYKKTTNGLVLKQVRPVFTGTISGDIIFLPEENTLYTFQGGLSEPNATHSQKSIWEFKSDGWIPQNDPASAPFKRARVTFVSQGKIVTNEVTLKLGSIIASSLPIATPHSGDVLGAWSGLTGQYAITTNSFVTLSGDAQFNLGFSFPFHIPVSQPFLLPSDALVRMTRGSVNPILLLPRNLLPGSLYYQGGPQLVTRGTATNGVSVETKFWRAVNGSLPTVGLGPTYSLWEWDQTTIFGLTTEPTILKGYFSQTYSPSRHNFTEEFVFEPSLEPGLSSQQLKEFRDKNIRQIYMGINLNRSPFSGPRTYSVIELVDSDGRHRPVPQSF